MKLIENNFIKFEIKTDNRTPKAPFVKKDEHSHAMLRKAYKEINLGDGERRAGNLYKAIEFYQNARKLFEKLGGAYHVANIGVKLAIVESKITKNRSESAKKRISTARGSRSLCKIAEEEFSIHDIFKNRSC